MRAADAMTDLCEDGLDSIEGRRLQQQGRADVHGRRAAGEAVADAGEVH